MTGSSSPGRHVDVFSSPQAGSCWLPLQTQGRAVSHQLQGHLGAGGLILKGGGRDSRRAPAALKSVYARRRTLHRAARGRQRPRMGSHVTGTPYAGWGRLGAGSRSERRAHPGTWAQGPQGKRVTSITHWRGNQDSE